MSHSGVSVVRNRTRRTTAVILSPSATVAAAAVDWLERTILELPVTTTRWRLKMANRNLLTNTVLTTPITCAGVYVGQPVLDVAAAGGRFTGAFAHAPAQALGGFAVPVDGTDYVSPWVTAPALQFVKDQPTLLSWDTATAATGTGLGQSVRQVYHLGGSTGAANLATLAPVGGTITGAAALGDLRIEYEYLGVEETILFVGDSITQGASTGNEAATNQGVLHHEAWPGVAGAKGGYTPINAGISSTVTGGWTDPSALSWTRLDLATTIPDACVIALGSNDILNVPLATIQANYQSICDYVRSIGIPRVFVATVMPRTDQTGRQGYLTATAAAGSSVLTCSIAPTVGPMLLGSGGDSEVVTVTSVAGSGPITVNLAAPTIRAHAGATSLIEGAAQIAYGDEMVRQQLNAWLRQMPDLTAACLDFDAVMTLFAGSARLDPRYFYLSGGPHPLRAGYQRMGQIAASIGRPDLIA